MSYPMTATQSPEDVFYPESDGAPMGETDHHVREMLALIEVLKWRYRDEDVYIAGNNFLYFEEGNPRAVVSPDVYAVRGISTELRRTFKVWKEGATPCFVIELSSKSTWLEDHGNKKAAYAKLGVEDYVLFDPEGIALDPPLKGFRLERGDYRPMVPRPDGGLEVRSLGLLVRGVEGGCLELRDARTGEVLPRSDAARARLARVEQELAARDEALSKRDARLAELEAEIAKLRGG